MDSVCILMSTYNGEKYLKEQVDSIFNQKNVDVTLIIHDDGSSDSTAKILKEYQKMYKVEIPEGAPGKHNPIGVGSNFLKLLRYALENYKEVNYFGFADQDDIWLEGKINTAIVHLRNLNSNKGLYFSKKKIVDEKLNYLREDYVNFHDDYSTDYISQNDASGCTMVFTRAFAEMLMNAPVEKFPYLHDVYICKVALCTDTKIYCDENETMLYRQHNWNVEGVRNVSIFSKENICKIFKKRRHYLYRITDNIFEYYGNDMLDEYKFYLNLIIHYKNPVYTLRILRMYYGSPYRSIKEKLRITMMLIMHGI